MKTSIGLCGATGKTPELQIGQVKTVDYTQKASVEITGTRENPILNFNIPKGKDGAKLIVREYFNGDIQILNNLNELPEDTNSDTYGKTVMSVNGIKQLLEKINDVLTKANANTNAIGSLTSTVQGNKADIETKLNNFKSDTDTKVQSINQSISELEQTIETKLNEELTKQVKALQDENKKLNDMIFENSLKENFEGSDNSISDTSNGVALIETIKGQTIVTDAPTETNPNYKNIESIGEKENNKISILSNNKNLFNIDKYVKGAENKQYYSINDKGNIVINALDSRSSTGYLDGCFMLKPNTNYTLSCSLPSSKLRVLVMNTINNWSNITPSNGQFNTGINGVVLIKFIEDNGNYPLEVSKIQLEEGTQATEYIASKEDKKEILLPIEGGLKSLPNKVCDTIEQKEDGFYLVQRIGKVVLNGSENEDWRQIGTAPNYTLVYHHFNAKLIEVAPYCYPFLNNQLPYTNKKLDNLEEEGCYTAQDGNVCVSISSNKLETPDSDGFKKWLQQNNMLGYYVLEKPIETKLDIDNLNLKTFKDLTYVTSENNIKPVLKGQATKDITTVIKNLQSKGAN